MGRLTDKNKEALARFQTEYNRALEEDFARTLTEQYELSLYFVNDDRAVTDGQDIVVDPGIGRLFADTQALSDTEDYLRLDHSLSSDRGLALRVITRAQNIHESLHLIYSQFPPAAVHDPRSTTRARLNTLNLITNIIEDAFIEAAGCSIYDNMAHYLLFHRVSSLFVREQREGTVDRTFRESGLPSDEAEPRNAALLLSYLNHMAMMLLYPMVRLPEPEDALKEYVEKTEGLSTQGSTCGDPGERYTYSQRVFDIIAPLIPEDVPLDFTELEWMLQGRESHSGRPAGAGSFARKGKTARITRRLFSDLQGKPLSPDQGSEGFGWDIKQFKSDQEKEITVSGSAGSQERFTGSDFDCAAIHRDIQIEVVKPRIDGSLRRDYQHLLSQYRPHISTYADRLAQLLRGSVEMLDDKQYFGISLSSKALGDVKKRYWNRKSMDIGVPDLAVILMIDGSGSMAGYLREGAMASALLLHEVLRRNGIAHAIMEHRAIYGEALVQHRVLVGFQAREEDKYNLVSLDADQGTREGLSLYWAEQYLRQQVYAKNKLILMISDGAPNHGLADKRDYSPPVSIRDTREAVERISRRGTQIVAIALDKPGRDSCYRALKEMYPLLVLCTDLKQLTGQLLRLIAERLV